jgi:hypothetical protein
MVANISERHIKVQAAADKSVSDIGKQPKALHETATRQTKIVIFTPVKNLVSQILKNISSTYRQSLTLNSLIMKPTITQNRITSPYHINVCPCAADIPEFHDLLISPAPRAG